MKRLGILILAVLGCSSHSSSTEDSYYLPSNFTCDPTPPTNSDLDSNGIVPKEAETCDSGHYIIQIDRRFLCNQPDQVIQAWGNWTNILQDKITYSIQYPETLKDTFEACTIKVRQAYCHDNAPGISSTFGPEGQKKLATSIICLSPEMKGKLLEQAVIHELGHSLGLPHTVPYDPLDIMAASTPTPLLQTITCKDKKELCDIWGCDPGCQ